jgi:hypothetical protein
MHHCRGPKRVERGIRIYDRTFWHILVPEMVRRLQPRERLTSCSPSTPRLAVIFSSHADHLPTPTPCINLVRRAATHAPSCLVFETAPRRIERINLDVM